MEAPASQEPTDRLRSWLQDNQRPVEPPKSTARRLAVAVALAAAAAGIIAFAVTLAQPAAKSESASRNAVALVLSSVREGAGATCSDRVRFDSGDTQTLTRAACMRAGDQIITSAKTPLGLRRAARGLDAVIAGVTWFGIVVAAAGLLSLLVFTLRRRQSA